MAYNKGLIAAPENGRYRFWGIGDDILIVRIRRKVVIDANQVDWISEWRSTDERSRTYKISDSKLVIGDWFSLSKGRPIEMEVRVGECPGRIFYCHLLIIRTGWRTRKGLTGDRFCPFSKPRKFRNILFRKRGLSPIPAQQKGRYSVF